VTGLLGELVAAHPERPAVVDDRGASTWRQLDDRVSRLVHALRDRGLAEGDAVVAVLGNQVEAVEVALACAAGGWVQVPLNWHWVADEVAYVLDDCAAAAVVADVRWLDVVTESLTLATSTPAARLAVHGDAPGFESYEAVLAASPAEPGEAVKGGPMFYTSGTTGRPKGVRSSLTSVGGPPELFTLIAHSFRPMIQLPDEGAVQVICGPMYHSAQWVFASFSLLCGATLVLQHRFDAGGLLDLVDRQQVTNLHLVPTQMRRMLDLPAEQRAAFDGSSLRSVLHGAAPCPPAVKRAMIDWLGPIVSEYYGGTEGGFIATITADEWLERPGSVGRPVATMEVAILDPDGAPVAPGEAGDVWFRNLLGSDFEYHNAPDKTAASHRGGFATLGDIGYLDADGYLYLSDRRIDMIVSGGVNIYPAEIEGVLAAHPAVADVAVFGIPDEEMGEQVKAAVVLARDRSWDAELEAALVEHCRAHLAGYKRPRSFDVHDALPRLESGKLTKRVLRDPYWQEQASAIA